MGVSPVELITATKIEDGPLSLPSFPNKQAVPQHLSSHLYGTLTRKLRQFSSLQQNAEPARGRHGRTDHSLLQLLWKRRRQIQAQQGRVEGTLEQRAHRLPHVSEGSDAGGENHERPGLEQGQRSGLQRVCGAGGRPDCCLQRLLPRAEEENQVGERTPL